MNLSTDNRPPAGECGAGGGLGTVAHAGPAHPSWQDDESGWVQLTEKGRKAVADNMAASIVRLEHQLEEANARIAVLEEEQRIMQRKYAPRLTDEDDGFETVAHKEAADRMGGNPWSNI
jgi:hypothetical protein